MTLVAIAALLAVVYILGRVHGKRAYRRFLEDYGKLRPPDGVA